MKKKTNLSQKRRREQAIILTGRICFGVILIAVWEFCSGRYINSFWLSKPSLIIKRIYDLILNGKLWYHLSATLQEVLLGIVAGMAIGVVLAIALAYSGYVQHWVSPYILALFSLLFEVNYAF